MTTPMSRPPFLPVAHAGITPAGWYTIPDGRSMWWDSQRWVDVPALPVAPQPAQAMQPVMQQPQMAAPTRMVTKVPVQTNHTAHLIATLCTCGFWLPMWMLSAVVNSYRTQEHVSRIK